jgi:hypothetical protein
VSCEASSKSDPPPETQPADLFSRNEQSSPHSSWERRRSRMSATYGCGISVGELSSRRIRPTTTVRLPPTRFARPRRPPWFSSSITVGSPPISRSPSFGTNRQLGFVNAMAFARRLTRSPPAGRLNAITAISDVSGVFTGEAAMTVILPRSRLPDNRGPLQRVETLSSLRFASPACGSEIVHYILAKSTRRLHHSERSASIGSMRAARRAGM